mmetsp:Transcript_2525/g.6619  ORF Transcript_2525/g.6619 Transcript_2525/m.6619 type:complete len:86 (-) Transcript_2525:328-585(-)
MARVAATITAPGATCICCAAPPPSRSVLPTDAPTPGGAAAAAARGHRLCRAAPRREAPATVCMAAEADLPGGGWGAAAKQLLGEE